MWLLGEELKRSLPYEGVLIARVAAAVAYAHAHNQLVGGSVFGKMVPPGSEFASLLDDPVAGSTYGFEFSTSEIANLQASSPIPV